MPRRRYGAGPGLLLGLALVGRATVAWPLGDVQVTVTDGELTLLGDDAPNVIQITPGIGTGAFVVTALESTGVNGAASIGVTDVRKITVDLKEGQDRLELLQIDLEEDLFAKLGSDADVFLMDGGRIKGRAEVKGGKDGDDLTVRNGARVGGRLVLSTGKKSDTITVNNASVGGGLKLQSGGGTDHVTIQFTTFDAGHDAVIQSGDGDDFVVFLASDFEGDFELDLGDGDDDVTVEDCDFDGEIFADGGDGDDEVDLRGENSVDLGERRRFQGFEDFD